MNGRPRIEKLRRDHPVDVFDCGQEALNRFLVRYAFQNQQAEASQTYVALMGDEVVGFNTLVVAQVEYDDAPQRLGKGLAKHPIPGDPALWRRKLVVSSDPVRRKLVGPRVAFGLTAAGAESTDAVPREAEPFTPKQGQYLAFIYYYTKIHGRPPAEADLQRFFRVTPPVVHR